LYESMHIGHYGSFIDSEFDENEDMFL